MMLLKVGSFGREICERSFVFFRDAAAWVAMRNEHPRRFMA